MFSLFHSRDPETGATVEPVATVFPTVDGAVLAADFLSERVAGDFYDFVRVSPERVLFGLLDVAGRREENRGILAAAQSTFRTLGTDLFSHPDLNESEAMTELCLRINRGLIETSHGVHACPAFIGCYHEKLGTLCYTNAGHTPGLLRDRSGIVQLGSTGLPLGLFSHATCEAPTVGLEKDAALLLVSRGVIESRGHIGQSTEDFGLERVQQLFQAAPSSDSAAALCGSILRSVGEFGGDAPPADDRTALALVRTA